MRAGEGQTVNSTGHWDPIHMCLLLLATTAQQSVQVQPTLPSLFLSHT
jgi:hypothetical protein